MLAVLSDGVYARLFGAQVVALLGTGLLTVALGLLAFDVAGGEAGIVMGTAMTIKMIAYVAVAPVVTALTTRAGRKQLLVTANVVRTLIALCLPLVGEAWQIYVLIFLLQSASATFTPAFQAVIPSVLPDERDYTRALSLSRLAYDLESLLSPAIAALLLTVASYHDLFVGTVVGFAASAALVASARLPAIEVASGTGFLDRLSRGARRFIGRRELRGLLALDLVVASGTAMLIVNTVVLVQADLGRAQSDVALLLAAGGAGSMAVALVVPRLLDAIADRTLMLAGAALMPAALTAMAATIHWGSGPAQWLALIGLWFVVGAASSAILTPSARLLARNSGTETRGAVFTAQFSLSHACFLLTYPLAGGLGAAYGLSSAAVILAGTGAVGTALAFAAWREPATRNLRTSPR
ncbi:MFS transporter [Zhihengliuella halotolerans]|uniref:Putative MFS family arabinose efflux permease n=1 Tax=Zhihengliuella halotolerans TaxID=370736 RepID=A0A4Q8AFM4_9MICC|nr:MFS transporter [Zhihengliuella halotolerans]RZU63120.1 putative MFS family arabinose efflux permease [Zhihengliuella halotolerans]